MRATCQVARYFHVVGLVGQDKPRKLALVRQPPEGFRIGRAAADNAMGAKLERVAGIGDRDCAGRWRQWALLDPLAVKDDLINLLEFESGNLDRRAGQNQLLELDLELIEVPLPLFA